MIEKVKLKPENIQAIEKALTEKKRVEIVQTDKGLKIYNVTRKELNKSPVRG